jgi:hypothetical protein
VGAENNINNKHRNGNESSITKKSLVNKIIQMEWRGRTTNFEKEVVIPDVKRQIIFGSDNQIIVSSSKKAEELFVITTY